MIVLVMGVSGSGKSTIGGALAAALGAEFLEADTFHSAANISKMKSGIPLDDSDRWPWLEKISAALDQSLLTNNRVVLACSALKQSYREKLFPTSERVGHVVFLNGDTDLISKRMSERTNHYMPLSLLPSQFATLEPPSNAIIIDAARSLEKILQEILSRLPA